MKSAACIVLAAGAGTRMKSSIPKVLHPVAGQPILDHVLKIPAALGIRKVVVVAGHQFGRLKAHVGKRAQVVRQTSLRGTAHAVRAAEKAVGTVCKEVLILCGDTPLLRAGTIRRLIERKRASGASGVFLTSVLNDAGHYGRITRDRNGRVTGIVEFVEASPEQRALKEINVGVYLFDRKMLFDALAQVKPNPVKNEYFLTDIVKLTAERGTVETVVLDDDSESLGVNSRWDLALAEEKMSERILKKLAEGGVSFEDTRTIRIGPDVVIGADTLIRSHTVIEGPARIGRGCRIGPFSRIRDRVTVGDECVVGNFVELVRCRLGRGVNVRHLTYLGDAEIGEKANVGAGTITANFDGSRKYMTRIGAGASIGSGTVFVAPVTVGAKAKTGAGAVVTRNTRIRAQEVFVGVPARRLAGSQSKRLKTRRKS